MAAVELISGVLGMKAAQVMALAAAHGLTIVTAESCTAGRISALLSDAPHAGEHFYGGFVVYLEVAKEKLGVPSEVLEEYGAVSAETARLLSQSALAQSGADVSIAITGVVGPEEDDDGNPVGLVYLSASRTGMPTRVVKHDFGAMGREAILYNTLDGALHLLLETLGRRT
jgi:nicotinamide-nucleotide amidase